MRYFNISMVVVSFILIVIFILFMPVISDANGSSIKISNGDYFKYSVNIEIKGIQGTIKCSYIIKFIVSHVEAHRVKFLYNIIHSNEHNDLSCPSDPLSFLILVKKIGLLNITSPRQVKSFPILVNSSVNGDYLIGGSIKAVYKEGLLTYYESSVQGYPYVGTQLHVVMQILDTNNSYYRNIISHIIYSENYISAFISGIALAFILLGVPLIFGYAYDKRKKPENYVTSSLAYTLRQYTNSKGILKWIKIFLENKGFKTQYQSQRLVAINGRDYSFAIMVLLILFFIPGFIIYWFTRKKNTIIIDITQTNKLLIKYGGSKAKKVVKELINNIQQFYR